MREKTDLKTLLTKDSQAGEDALQQQAMWWQREQKKRRGGCELPFAFY